MGPQAQRDGLTPPADPPADAPAVSAPPSTSTSSKVTLAITTPFSNAFVYNGGKEPVTVTDRGTEVDAGLADEIIASAKEYGVTIEKKES